MGRHPKQGIDYFQADVDMFQDRKIKRLLRSAGSKGFTIYIYLLTYIYRDRGYYFEWDEDSAFDISDELNFSESVVQESVKACCSIGLFNEALFSEESILSSESIQQRWQKIVTDANRVNTNIDPPYQILGGKPVFLSKKNGKYTQETPDKFRESTQSKVKESKEKKNKEAAREAVDDFVEISLDRVHRLDNPLTEPELDKLLARFPEEVVRDVLVAMENHKKLTSKYTSAYLTALNWCKKRTENGQQPEQRANASAYTDYN